jgi:tetratricopeptide (TPR) repeat protein
MNNLAVTYADLGRHADALAMLENGLEHLRRVLPADHPDIGEGCAGRDASTSMSFDVIPPCAGSAYLNLGAVQMKLGALSRALACAREAHRIFQISLSPSHELVLQAASAVRQLQR